MKVVFNYVGKIFAGFLFVVLLAVNVQVGSWNSFSNVDDSFVYVDEAGADWCNPLPAYCTIDIFGNIIYGIHNDGVPEPKLK